MPLKRPVSIAAARRWPAAAKRRESFCARMGGMRDRLTGPDAANDPNSPINRALAAWDCDNAELLAREHISRGIRMRKKNPVEKLYTVTPASLLKEAKSFREYAEESLKYWIISKQTEKYPEAMAKARILETAAREKNVAVRREILKNSGFDIVRLKSSMPRKSRASNPIDDHELAFEDDGGGWIDSMSAEHNPRRRRNPAQRFASVKNKDGQIVKVPIEFRFKEYIANSQEDFFAHIEGNQLVVSEKSTGLRVGTVPYSTRAAALNDRDAARIFVKNTAERVGGEKFKAAINKAPKI